MLGLWPRLLTRFHTLLLSSEFGHIGSGSRISFPFRCANLDQVSLGAGVIIHRDCWISVLGNREQGNSIKLTIKSHTGIGMGATIAAARQIVIGEYVLL